MSFKSPGISNNPWEIKIDLIKDVNTIMKEHLTTQGYKNLSNDGILEYHKLVKKKYL